MNKEFSNKVRLTELQLNSIINAFKSFYLTTDHLWVFGSRADLAAKGGDIDLYIETDLDTKEAVDRKFKMVSKIWREIGEQKVDVVLNIVALQQNELEIYKQAKQTGVQLV